MTARGVRPTTQRDRIEQGIARGETPHVIAERLGLDTAEVERVFARLDEINRERSARPAALTAYGKS